MHLKILNNIKDSHFDDHFFKTVKKKIKIKIDQVKTCHVFE